ncbi:plakophilin-4 isoform X1, partial [Tachysurus ichikawai]
VGNLQRSSSQRSNMTYQRSNNFTAVTYSDLYRSGPYRPSEGSFTRHAIGIDDGAIRSPSIDSIQKDPSFERLGQYLGLPVCQYANPCWTCYEGLGWVAWFVGENWSIDFLILIHGHTPELIYSLNTIDCCADKSFVISCHD